MSYTKDELKDKFQNILQNNQDLVEDSFTITDNTFKISYTDLSLILDLDVLDYILKNPEEGLGAVREALEDFDYLKDREEDSLKVYLTDLPDSKIKTPRTLDISKDLGCYIGLKGVAKRVYEPEPEPRLIEFVCSSCGSTFTKEFEGKYIGEPTECVGCGKSSNKTNFTKNIENSKVDKYQEVFIEERDRSGRAGERPREEKALLRGHLVDSITSGDEVIVYGIFKAKEKKRGKGKGKLQTYFEVKGVEIENKEFDDQDLTEEERKRVKELAQDPDIFQKISRSIAPSIQGCDYIKKSIVLQFFKGVEKDLAGNHHRRDIHILLAGDPETGKSQLLDYASKISPRARKGSGRSTTGAGLIGGAVHEPDDRWYLEAGILPLADRGIACIDELDKMREEDRNSIHRAMEQQEVTINKADLRQTLRTKTSILGACNPKGGKFTKSERVDNDYLENIKELFNNALISRFDSIWIMTSDLSKKEKEERTKHLLDLQREYLQKEKDGSYEVSEDYKPEIEPEDLRNYIKLGRNIIPEPTEKAYEIIEDFANDLMDKLDSGYKNRLVNALVRYAEASAKAHLREKILPEDSKRAIELKKAELDRWKETGLDPEDYIEKKETGLTEEERTLLNEIRDIIDILEDQGKDPTKEKILEYAERDNIGKEEVKNELERLRTNGEVYTPKEGVYRLA